MNNIEATQLLRSIDIYIQNKIKDNKYVNSINNHINSGILTSNGTYSKQRSRTIKKRRRKHILEQA